jgi:hypothetical protein
MPPKKLIPVADAALPSPTSARDYWTTEDYVASFIKNRHCQLSLAAARDAAEAAAAKQQETEVIMDSLVQHLAHCESRMLALEQQQQQLPAPAVPRRVTRRMGN